MLAFRDKTWRKTLMSWFTSWFMSWFTCRGSPVMVSTIKKHKTDMGGVGGRVGGGGRVQTQTPIPNPFHPWPPILTHTHPINPFTHGLKHSHTPIPTPLLPMAQTQTPSPNPFHPWPPIFTHTYPLNPFTHGPKHSHTPIPTLLHPWPRHIHLPLTHFTHDPQCLHTPIP